MSRFKGRWQIHNAEHLREASPGDFALAREVVGLRLCGVSDIRLIREMISLKPGEARPSLWKVKKILSGFGQVIRGRHHQRGLWFPFGSIQNDYLHKLFDFPAWLPRRGLMQYGYANDLRVIAADTLSTNVRAFKEDHKRYCLARERQRDARAC